MDLALLVWTAPAAACALAVERWARARSTRQQTVDALAKVVALTGAVPAATAERAVALADALARRLGIDPTVASTAARLSGLPADVLTESGIRPAIRTAIVEALNAPRGQARGAAAVVRVVHAFLRRVGDDASWPSAALFRTVVEHSRGDERRVAEALVRLVQGNAAPA